MDRFGASPGCAQPARQAKAPHLVVIDAQGGGIGRQLIALVRQDMPDARITAVGTNSAATTAMLKAGADSAATGENAVIVACRKADIIAGPIGIVIADALFGEITPAMAAAVGQSPARRVLIPVNRCDNLVVGVVETSIVRLVQTAADAILRLAAGGDVTELESI